MKCVCLLGCSHTISNNRKPNDEFTDDSYPDDSSSIFKSPDHGSTDDKESDEFTDD